MTHNRLPTPRQALGRTARFAVLLAVLVFAGFPVYWMVNTGLSSEAEIFGSGQSLALSPARIASAFDVFVSVPILSWLGNSAFIAFGTCLLSVTMAFFAGYALSRYRFVGKGGASFLLFLSQMLPEAVLLVPLFGTFTALGLLNNLGGLVLVNTVFSMPAAVWIIKTAVDKIPYEIEESTRVDGASLMTRLWSVVFPLTTPSIAAASVITFFDGWNEYLFANTFLQSQERWPATVGLSSFIGQYSTPLSDVMMAAVVFTLPAVVFFLILQRQIVSGLAAGAVKG